MAEHSTRMPAYPTMSPLVSMGDMCRYTLRPPTVAIDTTATPAKAHRATRRPLSSIGRPTAFPRYSSSGRCAQTPIGLQSAGSREFGIQLSAE